MENEGAQYIDGGRTVKRPFPVHPARPNAIRGASTETPRIILRRSAYQAKIALTAVVTSSMSAMPSIVFNTPSA